MRLRDFIRAIYPVAVALVLLVLLILASARKEAVAGVIRKAELTPERPLVVRLASGRSTALSFPVRPEKVVPGNPQGVEINFLGRDLTLRPLSARPGNLIVYTKSSRYVILLQLTTESAYDDSVAINGFSSYSRPIRLTEDSFRVEQYRISTIPSGPKVDISALTKNSGRVIESDSLPSTFRCIGCVTRKINGMTQLACSTRIATIQCRNQSERLRLERTSGGD